MFLYGLKVEKVIHPQRYISNKSNFEKSYYLIVRLRRKYNIVLFNFYHARGTFYFMNRIFFKKYGRKFNKTNRRRDSRI